MNLNDTFRWTNPPLARGTVGVPAMGFGTLIPDPVVARRAIRTALEVGFRHIDGAEAYRNENVVGDAIADAIESGTVHREDLFVTMKLWNNNHRPERVMPALDASLQRLKLDYVDSYLIHTPFAFRPGDEPYPTGEDGTPIYDTGVTLSETWDAMERLVDAGKCRSIGLSDVRLDRLKEIMDIARIKPAVVQVESHPWLPEWELLDYCLAHGTTLVAFAPLGHGMEPRLIEDAVLLDIARRLAMTPAQVALAWAVQRGTAFLTTSTNPHHIRENFEISPLPAEELQEIRTRITANIRLNGVVETGLPGFIPRKASPTASANRSEAS